MDWSAYPLLIIAIFLGVAGQLFLKRGMSRTPGFQIKEIWSLRTNPEVIFGFLCYGVSTLFYVRSLATLNLALAYPTVSLGYVIVVILSRALFKEEVSWVRWAAVGIICTGVIVVGLAGSFSN